VVPGAIAQPTDGMKGFTVVWYLGRDMHRCCVCGHLFAYRSSAQRYCITERCQAEKLRRAHERKLVRAAAARAARSKIAGRGGTSAGEPRRSSRRAAQQDAEAALAELRAWVAAERGLRPRAPRPAASWDSRLEVEGTWRT
jgi:hypothetical protein